MNTLPFRKSMLLAILLMNGGANGETISWYSPIVSANLTSANQQMAGGVVFQLGVFANGFIPTPGNLLDWSKNWVSAQATTYNATTRVYDGMFKVTSNAAPFTKGAKAYIWYRSSSATQDEWMLYRKSDWTWPGTDNLTPFPLVWNAANADETIIGSVNAAGNPYLMKSEAVVSYAQWQNAQLDGSPLKGANDDADGDGVSNLLEYVFGTSPSHATPPTATPASLVGMNGRNYLEISIPREKNRLVKTTVEVSSDLVNWSSSAADLTNVTDTPALLVVRDKTAVDTALGKRFMRVVAATAP